MNKLKRKLTITAAILAIAGSAHYGASAQGGISFLKPSKDNPDGRSGKVPTVITSEFLDLDIEKNTAVFQKNVTVDDEEMNIECEKMTIFLEDTKPIGDASAKKNEKEKTGKQISRIICEKNVVITRKLPNANGGGTKQTATAGHADYDVKTGMIVLTKDPVLKKGNSSIKGEVITIWRDSEKVSVKHGSELILDSGTINDSREKTGEQPLENK
jgi:lipopolysaccharide transport protein LptA